MSAVTLLCADHSLPLYRSGSRRIRTAPSGPVAGDGFSVQTHKYYRQVVEELGLTMKPFQYELDLRAPGEDAAQLMLAGASAVAVGTALFADPFAPIKVRDGLEAIAARQGLEAVSGLTGGVCPW